jgi:hypothetical protein
VIRTGNLLHKNIGRYRYTNQYDIILLAWHRRLSAEDIQEYPQRAQKSNSAVIRTGNLLHKNIGHYRYTEQFFSCTKQKRTNVTFTYSVVL